jgi:hypothetical protein
VLPLMLWLGFKWTRPDVLQRAREQATVDTRLPASKTAAVVIGLIWCAVAGVLLVKFCL